MNQSQARGAKGSIEFDEMLEWLKKAGWGILNASIFMGFGAYLSAAGGDGPRAAVPGMIAGLICWIVGSRIRGLAGELLGGTIFGAIIGWFTKDYGGTKGAVVGALIVDGIILIYAAYQYIAARLKRQ